MEERAELVRKLGISPDAPKSCFIARTVSTMYEVSLSMNDLRAIYCVHYDESVKRLREAVSAFHRSPGDYVRTLHQFAHLTLIAFYEYVLPAESGVYDGYARLTDRAPFSQRLPQYFQVWKNFASLRNRVDHPVDKNTQTHSKPITHREMEHLHKSVKLALQELFDVWLGSPPPSAVAMSSASQTTT
jgi:hypothetical protein